MTINESQKGREWRGSFCNAPARRRDYAIYATAQQKAQLAQKCYEAERARYVPEQFVFEVDAGSMTVQEVGALFPQ